MRGRTPARPAGEGARMINFNLLRVFRMVAHTHSVVLAAERLYVSQPAVSSALKKLQQHCGLSLFQKSGRTIVLTKDGEYLLGIADKIFALEREIEDFIKSSGQHRNLYLHVGLVTLYERSGVTSFLEKLKEIDNSVSVSIHSGNSTFLIEKLRANEIDMTIAGDIDISSISGIERSYYRKHEIFLGVPRGHRLFGRETFLLEDLQGETLVSKDTGSAVRYCVDRYMEKHGITAFSSTELSNFDAILEIMRRDGSISFFPDDIAASLHVPNGDFALLRPCGEPLEFRTYIYTRRISSYAPAVRDFLKEAVRALERRG